MHETQYPIIAARRQSYDTLLWQVPALGIAAQSFLFSAALSKDASKPLSVCLWMLSATIGFAVVFLFRRLRLNEVADAKILEEYETANAEKGFLVAHGKKRVAGWSAYWVWMLLLSGFVALEAGGAIVTLCKISN